MLIDTHCHLSFKAFEKDWEDALNRARNKGIRMITIGSQRETSEKAISIAQKDGVFASIGFHPTHVEDQEFDRDWYFEYAEDKNVIAIGECGIDFFHIDLKRFDEILSKQEKVFRSQIQMAKQKNLPVVVHARDAKSDAFDSSYSHVLRIIKDENYPKCVVHCFGGSWEQAKKFLDLGCMISFTGIITFKNVGKDLIKVVKKTPMDSIMVETDSPYLAPEPHRGERCEPAFVEYVARAIADMRDISYDEIASRTTQNAKHFFNL